MGFSNPLLLAALGVLAVPVLVHLVNRAEREGQPFPSLMFLRRFEVRSRRRKTLRDRRLLALRSLGLALLVAAFAGPYLEAPPATDADGERVIEDTVLLLDASYSMQPPGRWSAARRIALDHIGRRPAGARTALLVFDDAARVVLPLGAAADVLGGALETLQPGTGGTGGLAAAFDLAADVLQGSPASVRQVVLISDLQRTALGSAGRLRLQAGTRLVVEQVQAPVGGNAAIAFAEWARDVDGSIPALRVRVLNTGDEMLPRVQLSLEVNGAPAGERSVELMPGASAEVDFPVVTSPDRVTPVRLRTGADAIAADNDLALSLFPEPPLEVALAMRGETWIGHAIAAMRAPAARIVDAADEASLLVADLHGLEPAGAAAIASTLGAGGGVLLALSGTDAPPSIDVAPLPTVSGAVVDYREGTTVRLDDHPAWQGNADALEAALATTRVYRVADLEMPPAARVMARLEDGRPWLWSYPASGGRVIVTAMALTPEVGNLVLEPGFAPLLQHLFRYLAGRGAVPPSYPTGAVADLARLAAGLPGARGWLGYLEAGGQLVVQEPDGGSLTLGSGEALLRLSAPGFYEVHRLDGRGAAFQVAANVDRDESILDAAGVEALHGRVDFASGSAAGTSAPPPRVDSRPAWWVLLAAALVLLAESLVANRGGRLRSRSTPPVET